MKVVFFFLFLTLTTFSYAQTEEEAIAKTCMNYIEGFYEGDTLKLISCIKPSLYKQGYMKNKNNGEYRSTGKMSFEKAKKYAKDVLESKHFVSDAAPKEVVVLDIMNHIAAAKITAWWGIDYMLLSKNNGQWIIEQVLWEGPLDKVKE